MCSESSELCTFEHDDVWRSIRREDIVHQQGASFFSDSNDAFFSGGAIVGTGKYFNSFFETVAEFIKTIASVEISHDCWNELFEAVFE